jgi:hypothetical protein
MTDEPTEGNALERDDRGHVRPEEAVHAEQPCNQRERGADHPAGGLQKQQDQCETDEDVSYERRALPPGQPHVVGSDVYGRRGSDNSEGDCRQTPPTGDI